MRISGRIIMILGLSLLSFTQLSAQLSNSLYFMNGVAQSNRVNPAHQPDCSFYFGIPGLAPLRSEVTSSSLAWDDVIYPHPTEDSLITFLHPLGDKQAFLDKLKPVNFVVSDFGSTVFSMGFRTGIGYISMDVSTRLDGNLFYPGDLARLVLEGADQGVTYTMDGMGVNLSAFDEVTLGWSGNIGDKWTIGIRGKALFGIGNLNTTHSEFSVYTSEEEWDIHSNMVIDASLPFAEVTYNDEGFVPDIVLGPDVQLVVNNLTWEPPFGKPDTKALVGYAFNTQNFGLGVDLGVNFRPTDRWLFSASVLDIGYINWTDSVHKVSYVNDYTYKSIELDPFSFSEDFTFDEYMDSTLTALLDTLVGPLEFAPGNKYMVGLNTKVYVGATWYATPNINFGILSRTDFLKSAIAEQVTASVNLSTGRFLNLTLSYSWVNGYFKNIGAGFSMNAGPLNLYVISDNALNTVFWPQERHVVNFWFGVNLTFGYSEKVDMPLIY
jgi:hypothetical protein